MNKLIMRFIIFKFYLIIHILNYLLLYHILHIRNNLIKNTLFIIPLTYNLAIIFNSTSNNFIKTPYQSAYLLLNTKERSDTMEDLLKAVANVGFPIAVAAYLLIRIEGKMDSLAASINQLSTILSIKLGNDNENKAA